MLKKIRGIWDIFFWRNKCNRKWWGVKTSAYKSTKSQQIWALNCDLAQGWLGNRGYNGTDLELCSGFHPAQQKLPRRLPKSSMLSAPNSMDWACGRTSFAPALKYTQGESMLRFKQQLSDFTLQNVLLLQLLSQALAPCSRIDLPC